MAEMIGSGVLEDTYAREKADRTKLLRKLEQDIVSDDSDIRAQAMVEIGNLYPAQTVPEWLDWISQKYGDTSAIKEARFEKDPAVLSYKELLCQVEAVSLNLVKWGMKKGDRVGMVTENSPEQLVFNLAVQSLGGIVIPWTKDARKNGGKTHAEIMNEAEADFVAIGDPELLSEFSEDSFHVVPITEEVADEIETQGRFLPHEECSFSDVQQMREEVKTEDPALMMFSSGTGGGSLKLVALTHKNLMHVTLSALEKSGMNPSDTILEILPWHHIYQYVTQYIALSTGQELSVSTVIDMKKSKLGILKDLEPDHITAVPLVWENIAKNIQKGIEKSIESVEKLDNYRTENILAGQNVIQIAQKRIEKLIQLGKSGIKKYVLEGVQKALKKGGSEAVFSDLKKNKGTVFEEAAQQYWKSQEGVAKEVLEEMSGIRNAIHIAVGKTLGFPALKKELGLENIHYIVNGGGMLSPAVAAIFKALDVDMKIGYGMSEATAMVTFGNPEKEESPFVSGETLPGIHIEVRPDEDGLDVIWIAGPMLGKYVDKELNKDLFDERGFYCTGDIGILQKNTDGTYCLSVTGRKKSMIKLKGGEAVLPEPIESAVKNSPFFEDVFVHGTEKLSALQAYCVVSFEALSMKFKNISMTKETWDQIEIIQYLKEEIRRLVPHDVFGVNIGEMSFSFDEFPAAAFSRSNKIIRPKLATILIPA